MMEDYQLMQIGTDENQIVAYVKGEDQITNITCQIGMQPCEQVDYEVISESNLPIHTILLVDNSLSVTEKNKEKIKDVLKSFIQSRYEQEKISIAVFGEDVQFLTWESVNAEELNEAVDSIQQYNQDTFLTDVLYELLGTLKNKKEYTRFIIISDGVDNKEIGITKEELVQKLKSQTYPVYTIGHIYKENHSELENMFALSRMTNGQEFLLDDTEDVNEIISELSEYQNILSIKVNIPVGLMDGSTQNVLMKLESGTSEYEIRTQVEMPFTLMEKSEPEAITEDISEIESDALPTGIQKVEPDLETGMEEEWIENTVEFVDTQQIKETVGKGANIVKSAGFLILVIAVFLCIVLIRKESNGKKSKKKDKPLPITVPVVPENKDERGVESDMTVLVEGRYLLVLTDIKDPDKIFKYPMDDKVVVGRNVDKANIVIDYSQTISGKHCEIYSFNNRFYIRDLNSSNHTYLNKNRVNNETELISGSIIQIGEIELSVEFIPVF